MNNSVTTSFLIAAGISLSACNVTTSTFSISESADRDSANYVARSVAIVNAETRSQGSDQSHDSNSRSPESPASSSAGGAWGGGAFQTASAAGQASEGGAERELPTPDKDGAAAEAARAEEASRQNRNAAGELDKEAPAPSPDKDGAAAEAARAEEASRQSSPDSQADKEANDPLPISTETGKMAVEHDPNEDKDGNAPAPQAEPQHNVDSKDGTSNETASSNGGGNQVGQAEVDHNTAQQGTAPVTDEPSKD